MSLPPLPQPHVMTGRNSVLYVGGLPSDTSTAFTADQMRAYATKAVLEERERCAPQGLELYCPLP